MSNVEVMKFTSTRKPRNSSVPAGQTSAPTAAPTPHPSAARTSSIVEAAFAHESMMSQLRDIITGPQAKLSDARYSEFIEILSEQKSEYGTKFRAVDQILVEVNGEIGLAKNHLRSLDTRSETQQAHFEAQLQKLHQVQVESLEKVRAEHALELMSVTDLFSSRIKELEVALRAVESNILVKLEGHVTEDNNARERERQNLGTLFEQRLAQSRAEIEEGQRRDGALVASAIMEIGRKLAQQHQG